MTAAVFVTRRSGSATVTVTAFELCGPIGSPAASVSPVTSSVAALTRSVRVAPTPSLCGRSTTTASTSSRKRLREASSSAGITISPTVNVTSSPPFSPPVAAKSDAASAFPPRVPSKSFASSCVPSSVTEPAAVVTRRKPV